MAKRKQSTAGASMPVTEFSATGRKEPIPTRRKSSRGGAPSTVTNGQDSPEHADNISPSQVSQERRGGVVNNVRNVGTSADVNTDLAATEADMTGTGTIQVRHGPATLGGQGHGSPQGGDAEEANAPGGPSADLSSRPGRNKRKQAPLQHVKENSALDDNTNGNSTLTPESAVRKEEDVGMTIDPEAEEAPKDNEVEDEEEVKEALSRAPPVNSDYLPLPWKGRLGYACLNTYLRNANPPVFSSRTCRIASILENRHPLKDPAQPAHPTKNRPDRDQPADIARGQRYVEELGLSNARDITKMVRWNDKYGIKFMRLSSEMFPFASHLDYGYKLAPFASETLAEVGKVIAELGHRVTTHPGQFTQLGSPRKEVITASVRDLDYHAELLSLLKLPPQQDRDAVMILHLGGAYGDKAAALDRFRENYAKLSDSVQQRLVLENDDVVWHVHDLLPICQELNIPFVLDFHHHNIVFDPAKIREGTKDIVELFPAIMETWTKKGMTPKMHYSEPCPDAVTNRDRRKHSPRVMTLPPCPPTMDLMIEAKDKEQAVFQLMRTFKLPGFDLMNDVVPHVRLDENKPLKPKPKKAAKRGKNKKADDLDALDEKIEDGEDEEKAPPQVPEEDVSMGGPQRRVFWPVGMEYWLRPAKRITKKKEEGATPRAVKKRKTAAAAEDDVSVAGEASQTPAKKPASKRATGSAKKKVAPKSVPEPSPSTGDSDGSPLSDLGDDDEDVPATKKAPPPAPTRKRSGRVVSRVSYHDDGAEEDAEE